MFRFICASLLACRKPPLLPGTFEEEALQPLARHLEVALLNGGTRGHAREDTAVTQTIAQTYGTLSLIVSLDL